MNATAFNKNNLKTVTLLASLGGALVIAGSALGGRTGTTIGLILGVAMVGGSYWFSDRLALRSAGARVITEADHPAFYGMVRDLAARADLPMPRVAVSPNPFSDASDFGNFCPMNIKP